MIMLNLDLMWTGSSVCEGGSGGIQAIKSIAEDSVDLSRAPRVERCFCPLWSAHMNKANGRE